MSNIYKCKEIDLNGAVVSQVYKGETKDEIIDRIRSKGHRPVKVELDTAQSSGGTSAPLFQKRVKTKQLAIFCKQMHTMLNAGMPLITALEVLAEQTDHSTLRTTLKAMAIQVQKGDVLSIAMKQHRKIFPVLLINMVEAGELTGNLDNVLDRMAVHYTKENKINSKIKGAMIYPIILSFLAVSVVTFLLLFIMPTFISMFTNAGVALPGPTRVLIAFSNALKNYWYLFILGIVLLVFAFKAFKSSLGGKRFLDRLKLNVPFVKRSVAQIITSRFTRTLSTLMGSGIPILRALESAATVTGNQVVIEGIGTVSEEIKKGAQLSRLLKRVGVFPPMMISMVSIGEESGSLEEMLEKTADYYDEELEVALQRLVAIMEPVMILVMAVLIGFIVIAMVMPMFDMMKTVG